MTPHVSTGEDQTYIQKGVKKKKKTKSMITKVKSVTAITHGLQICCWVWYLLIFAKLYSDNDKSICAKNSTKSDKLSYTITMANLCQNTKCWHVNVVSHVSNGGLMKVEHFTAHNFNIWNFWIVKSTVCFHSTEWTNFFFFKRGKFNSSLHQNHRND